MNRQLRIIVAARVMVVALAIVLSSVRFSVAVEAIDVDPALRMRPPAFQTRTHFAEPLMATAPTTLVEDRVFARTLARYDRRRRVDDLSALRKYLARFPHSGWRVSLLVNLGLEYKHYGYLSRALDSWESAWREGKSVSGPYPKALVDRAVGELALLHAELGHPDRVKALLDEIGDRPVANPGGEWVQKARETLWVMQNDPKHVYLCGPLALKFLMIENAATSEQVKFVNRYHAGPKGVSLADVSRLANDAKVALAPVFRNLDQPIPAPSIVHWKIGHFAAILGRENGGYRIKDPVLGRHEMWVSAEAIDAESSGYFLTASGETQAAGWRQVDATEAGQVWGAGPVTGPDPNSPGPPANPPPSGCPLCGYNVSELAVAVTLSDRPVGYIPAIGPSAKVTISYSQREASQPAVFGYFNVSPNWTMSWMRFIQDDPNNVGQSVMRYRDDGSAWMYSGYVGNTGAFAPEEGDSSVTVLTSQNPVTYQRQLQDGSIEVYSQSDGSTSYPRNVFLTSIIDPQGNALQLNYSNTGGHVKLTSLTDATGRNTTFTYASAVSTLLITQITDPFGRSANLAYDGNGRLTSITDIIGLTSQFTYDASSLVNSLTTPYGTTQFAYGGTGSTRFVQVTDPLGLKEREESLQPAPVASSDAIVPNMNPFNAYLNYRDSFHWDKHEYGVAGCTSSGGCNYNDARDTHFYHDAQNINIEWYQIEAIKQPLETRVWYNYPGQVQNLYNGTYDQPSVVGRIVNGNASQLWQKTYNSFGNPTQIIDAAGRTTNLIYAANQIDLLQVQQMVQSAAQTTAAYTYNTQHRPLTYTDAAGQVTQYAYNSAGQLTQLTLPTGAVWNFTYDSFGRLTQITNPNGITQASYIYDAFDRVATATDSEGYTLNYAYDAADRLTKITYPDSSTRQYAYNKLDLASVTDREGRTNVYAYDANRRLISATDPLGYVTQYAYWENNQLKSITDPKGNVTSWAIDLQSRPASKQYADGSTVVYGYDDSGRLKSIRDALGQIKQYAYTIDNRISSINYSYASNPTPSVAFTYDPYFPRVAAMSDGVGATSWSYAPVGSLGALRLQGETGPAGVVSYSYDALGRTVGRAVDGSAEGFAYDQLNRVIGHTNPLGQFALTYVGQTSQIASRTQTSGTDYPAHTVWSYLPNSEDRRLAGIANTAMRQFDYTTTPENLITGITETGLRHWSYRYDADNRLSGADYVNALKYKLTLDPDGNIAQLTNNSAKTTGAYNDLNELVTKTTAEAVFNYSYDANGNVLSDGQRSYFYDAENRLVGIGYNNSSATTSFAYDGLGRRITITDAVGSQTPVATYYQWCGSRICGRLNASGSPLRFYYDEGEAWSAIGQMLYYGPDQLGSPRNFAVASGSAATVKSLDFDLFGNSMTGAASPTATLPDFRFAGMFYHAASGLYLTQYRAYDPRTARWLSRDPLGEKVDTGPTGMGFLSAAAFPILLANPPTSTQIMVLNASSAPDPWLQSSIIYPSGQTGVSGNLYAYGNGNPINDIDPSGLVTLSGGVTSNNYLDPTGTVQPLSDTPPTGYPSGPGFQGSHPRSSSEGGACFNYAPLGKSGTNFSPPFHFYRSEGTDLNGVPVYSWVNGNPSTPGGTGNSVVYSTAGYMQGLGLINK